MPAQDQHRRARSKVKRASNKNTGRKQKKEKTAEKKEPRQRDADCVKIVFRDTRCCGGGGGYGPPVVQGADVARRTIALAAMSAPVLEAELRRNQGDLVTGAALGELLTVLLKELVPDDEIKVPELGGGDANVVQTLRLPCGSLVLGGGANGPITLSTPVVQKLLVALEKWPTGRPMTLDQTERLNAAIGLPGGVGIALAQAWGHADGYSQQRWHHLRTLTGRARELLEQNKDLARKQKEAHAAYSAASKELSELGKQHADSLAEWNRQQTAIQEEIDALRRYKVTDAAKWEQVRTTYDAQKKEFETRRQELDDREAKLTEEMDAKTAALQDATSALTTKKHVVAAAVEETRKAEEELKRGFEEKLQAARKEAETLAKQDEDAKRAQEAAHENLEAKLAESEAEALEAQQELREARERIEVERAQLRESEATARQELTESRAQIEEVRAQLQESEAAAQQQLAKQTEIEANQAQLQKSEAAAQRHLAAIKDQAEQSDSVKVRDANAAAEAARAAEHEAQEEMKTAVAEALAEAAKATEALQKVRSHETAEAELQARLETLEQELTAATEVNEKITSDLTISRATVQECENTKAVGTQRLSELENELVQAAAATRNLKQQEATLTKARATALFQLAACKASKILHFTDLGEVKQKLEAEVETLTAKIEACQRELAQRGEEAKGLKQAMAAQSKQAKGLEHEKAEYDAELKKVRDEHVQAQDTIQRQAAELARKDKLNQEHAKMIQKVNDQFTEIKNLYTTDAAKNEVLIKQNEVLMKQNKVLIEQNAALEAKNAEMRKANQSLSTQTVSLQESLDNERQETRDFAQKSLAFFGVKVDAFGNVQDWSDQLTNALQTLADPNSAVAWDTTDTNDQHWKVEMHPSTIKKQFDVKLLESKWQREWTTKSMKAVNLEQLKGLSPANRGLFIDQLALVGKQFLEKANNVSFNNVLKAIIANQHRPAPEIKNVLVTLSQQVEVVYEEIASLHILCNMGLALSGTTYRLPKYMKGTAANDAIVAMNNVIQRVWENATYLPEKASEKYPDVIGVWVANDTITNFYATAADLAELQQKQKALAAPTLRLVNYVRAAFYDPNHKNKLGQVSKVDAANVKATGGLLKSFMEDKGSMDWKKSEWLLDNKPFTIRQWMEWKRKAASQSAERVLELEATLEECNRKKEICQGQLSSAEANVRKLKFVLLVSRAVNAKHRNASKDADAQRETIRSLGEVLGCGGVGGQPACDAKAGNRLLRLLGVDTQTARPNQRDALVKRAETLVEVYELCQRMCNSKNVLDCVQKSAELIAGAKGNGLAECVELGVGVLASQPVLALRDAIAEKHFNQKSQPMNKEQLAHATVKSVLTRVKKTNTLYGDNQQLQTDKQQLQTDKQQLQTENKQLRDAAAKVAKLVSGKTMTDVMDRVNIMLARDKTLLDKASTYNKIANLVKWADETKTPAADVVIARVGAYNALKQALNDIADLVTAPDEKLPMQRVVERVTQKLQVAEEAEAMADKIRALVTNVGPRLQSSTVLMRAIQRLTDSQIAYEIVETCQRFCHTGTIKETLAAVQNIDKTFETMQPPPSRQIGYKNDVARLHLQVELPKYVQWWTFRKSATMREVLVSIKQAQPEADRVRLAAQYVLLGKCVHLLVQNGKADAQNLLTNILRTEQQLYFGDTKKYYQHVSSILSQFTSYNKATALVTAFNAYASTYNDEYLPAEVHDVFEDVKRAHTAVLTLDGNDSGEPNTLEELFVALLAMFTLPPPQPTP